MSHFSTPIGSECAEFWLMNYPNYIIEILIRSCRQLVREIIAYAMQISATVRYSYFRSDVAGKIQLLFKKYD